MGRLEAGDSQTLTFLWNATPCDSLSTIVEFIVGGFREDDETAVGDVSEALAAIVTVEDILLKAMTQRELDGRCGDSVSSSRRNLLSADGGDSSDDSEPSRALAYGGAGVASLLAGLAAWRRKSSAGLAPRRRKSSAESKLEGASEAGGPDEQRNGVNNEVEEVDGPCGRRGSREV